MRARIGGLELNGMDIAQRSRFTIHNDGLRGWFEGVGVKRDAVERQNAHGDYDLPVFREARVVSIQGLVNTRSDMEQDEAINALLGVCADGGRELLTIESPLGPTWTYVRLSDGTEVDRLVLGRTAKYRLTLRAADPRRYGAVQSFTGTEVDVHHYGNAIAAPVVEVAGPHTAPYTVTGPDGRVVGITQTLTASQTHRIDFSTGRVERNGVAQLGATSSMDVWGIPAGRPAPMTISSGVMTVSVADTYL
ncbi:hypothetical protein MUN78_04405 [Leucobacter allii]|uniref:Phage tail protein n=1 Tax=Leucobacter allii TaxID=2932247 RepID=A0ABY4FP75_9MICO|nr:hypothetical protein [Leucobacter allii]UOQ58093.1 hypothetical protein MUN78_04405 [Leucobacter allii]